MQSPVSHVLGTCSAIRWREDLLSEILASAFSSRALLSAPVLGKLSDRLGRKPVLFVSLLGSPIGGPLGAWLGPSAPMYFAAAITAVTALLSLVVVPESLSVENLRAVRALRTSSCVRA